ncbi:hypothetical protein AB1Y20_021920 [Prymnesium parvum]|uniref:DNA-directed DNA polymerase n=1 Tax=Prymnesium parvum TaxID=97485 RepID=A0AB34JHF1_PRYPA
MAAASSVRLTDDHAQPLCFTAPHAIYLCRDDAAIHKPEDLTGWLAESLAAASGGVALLWARAEVHLSARRAAPNPANRDPNYLHVDELEANPWNTALRGALSRWPEWSCLVCDLHGRRDHIAGVNDASDLDVGLLPLAGAAPHAVARLVHARLEAGLRDALAPTPFALNMSPRLSGLCAAAERRTLSQQAVALRQPAVQLELSSRLRRALHEQPPLLDAIARLLLDLAHELARAQLPPPPAGASPPLASPRLRAPASALLPSPPLPSPSHASPPNDSPPHASSPSNSPPLPSPPSDSPPLASPLASPLPPPSFVCAYFSYSLPFEWLAPRRTPPPLADAPHAARALYACDGPAGWGGAACGLAAASPPRRVRGALCWLSAAELAAIDRSAAPAPRRPVRVRLLAGGASLAALTHSAHPPPPAARLAASVPYLCVLRRAVGQAEAADRPSPLLPAAPLYPLLASGEACFGACGARSRCGGCEHPADAGRGFRALPLDGFLTEVGMRVKPPWRTLATVMNVRQKLASHCDIHSTEDLAANLCVARGGRLLNQRLQKRGQHAFRTATLDVMRKLLGTKTYEL